MKTTRRTAKIDTRLPAYSCEEMAEQAAVEARALAEQIAIETKRNAEHDAEAALEGWPPAGSAARAEMLRGRVGSSRAAA